MIKELDFIKWAKDNGHGKLEVPIDLMRIILNYQQMVESKFENLDINHVIKCKPEQKDALNGAVKAIYFADNSDYLSGLYDVVCSLTNLDEPTDDDIKMLYNMLNPD